MPRWPNGVAELGAELRALGWVTDVWVGGSAATGDYRPGVSDLDLVAITDGPVRGAWRDSLREIHRTIDRDAAGADLGCVYADAARLSDLAVAHPTWAHGGMVDRALSGITRAELVRYGCAVWGRAPQLVLPAVDDDDVRCAARAELTGYWARTAMRPWWWLDRELVDLGLTSMARGRHAMSTGQLQTKTAAIENVDAPPWLVEHLRACRRGEAVHSPRLRSAWHAWRDAVRTTVRARHPC